MTFHAGEIAVQQRLGVTEFAQQIGSSIRTSIKPNAREFLQTQRLAIASTVDAQGHVWASLITGHPGFVQPLTEQFARIEATLVPEDPLIQNLLTNPEIGLLIIDLATRRRLRMNGQVKIQDDGSWLLRTCQSYFNCPKYIQTRYLELTTAHKISDVTQHVSNTLTELQHHWLAETDTFFIASFHPTAGADASHRGGYPGFVHTQDERTLIFPDYAGNNMYQTLGNLVVNPHAGLLLIDFKQGHILQLTGNSNIVWESDRLAEFAGAERLLEFHIKQVIETRNATFFRWQFGDYSPANPVFAKQQSSPDLVR